MLVRLRFRGSSAGLGVCCTAGRPALHASISLRISSQQLGRGLICSVCSSGLAMASARVGLCLIRCYCASSHRLVTGMFTRNARAEETPFPHVSSLALLASVSPDFHIPTLFPPPLVSSTPYRLLLLRSNRPSAWHLSLVSIVHTPGSFPVGP